MNHNHRFGLQIGQTVVDHLRSCAEKKRAGAAGGAAAPPPPLMRCLRDIVSRPPARPFSAKQHATLKAFVDLIDDMRNKLQCVLCHLSFVPFDLSVRFVC